MFVTVEDHDGKLWTVGYYTNDDEGSPVFVAMEDFPSAEEAWAFIHYLNGGSRVLFER
jgi:hypothetical protein